MKITMEKENLIIQGMTVEENAWGAYQFPRPFVVDGRILVAVHVSDDGIATWGEPNRWFESCDEGNSWHEVSPQVAVECGLLLANGDRIFFPMESGQWLDDYKIPSFEELTPNYDFSKRAAEGCLPIQDGLVSHLGTNILAYNADRLPPTLAAKEWTMLRLKAGETKATEEKAQVDWPYLTRVVFENKDEKRFMMKSIFPRGNAKLGPDNAIWITAFSGEGHINPANGQYSPYYSAELFRSTDNGKTFQQRGHLEYPANGEEYPYLSGGFSDSDIGFMPDGSIIWIMRSAWFCLTAREQAPMYFARSTDNGFSWSKPVEFAPLGILPRICKLGNGKTLICYARPGIFIQVCEDDCGLKWSEPFEVMTAEDRSRLANVEITNPTFHQWDGACNNPELIALASDPDSALLVYSDFYYPDAQGVKRKSILACKITVSDN